MAEWQTRRIQNPLSERACGFESHPGHTSYRLSNNVSKAAIEKKLSQTSDDLRAAREEVRVLDEQVAHFADSADDARLRAMVSETPLADREHRDAARTVAALQRDREVWQERVAKLETRQDELLDEMLESK